MTVPAEYFDAMYAKSADPWGFADRWYERRKYAVTLACLPQERYERGYEPGCSIGLMSLALADRCDRLLASDGAQAAVDQARVRLEGHPGVTVERRRLPEQWPDGEYDLVILSELLYYFAGEDLAVVLDRAVPAVRPGGTLVAVHWRHPVSDHPRSGDEVHHALALRAASAGLVQLARHQEDDFLLDVYVRPSEGEAPLDVSVAARGGLT
jgi:SAM-dependent methyltransferase